MGRKIFGAILLVSGIAIVLSGILELASGHAASGAYGVGKLAGYAFGILLAATGLHLLRKKPD